MSEAKKYDRSYKEQSVKLALEIGVKRASEECVIILGKLIACLYYCFNYLRSVISILCNKFFHLWSGLNKICNVSCNWYKVNQEPTEIH